MRVAVSIALATLFLRVSITFGAGLDNPLALRGIIFVKDPKLPEIKFALLEQASGERSLLAEGQRNRGLEVVRISPELSKVRVGDGKTGQTRELFLKKPVERPAGAPMMQVESAHMAEVVTFFQLFSGRTVISTPFVMSSSLTFTTTACNSRTEAAAALKGVFETNRVILSRRGEKFEILVSDREWPLLDSVVDPPKSDGTPEKDVIPAGLIAFHEVDVLQFLQVYGELAGRTMIRSLNLPASKITLKAQTAVTRSEAVWMFESALRLVGITIVPKAKRFAFALRPEMTNGLLLDSIVDPPKPDGTPEKDMIPAGLIAFTDIDVRHVLPICGELTGRTLIRPENLPPAKITLKTQTAVTRNEAVWMLESALRLTGIAIVPEAKQFAFALRPGTTNGLPHFDRETAKARAKTTNGLPHLVPENVKGAPNSAVARRYQFDAAEFLQMYGALVGREPIPLPPGFSRLSFYLEGDRLDAAEAVYALEALGWVNGVAFEAVGTNKVALTFLPTEKR